VAIAEGAARTKGFFIAQVADKVFALLIERHCSARIFHH
jgi:hypothetical protein